jgi:uncharacterized protein (DUF2336 family)
MIVRKFIQWSQGVSAAARADGVAALSRAYLYSEMDPAERQDAEYALYALLDDPSPLVRRTLAEAFAGSPDAPRAIVHGLACDQSEISTLVLARSPLLTDAELIDCAAIGDSAAQASIALRADLSPAVSAALAEIASREAAIALAVNESAQVPDFALRRLVERFGDDGEVREALLGRSWLPAVARATLADATARALADFAVSRHWLSSARGERIALDARDRATMIIAAGCADYSEETAALAAYLRASGQLTPGVALRALLCGQSGLFEATLVELSGLSARRVAGLARDPRSDAFAAVYGKAGLPPHLLAAFRAALAALARDRAEQARVRKIIERIVPDQAQDGALRLPLIQAVLAECAEGDQELLGSLIALLRRFELDAARDRGRRGVARMQAGPHEAGDLFGAPQAMVARPDSALDGDGLIVDLQALERELIAA